MTEDSHILPDRGTESERKKMKEKESGGGRGVRGKRRRGNNNRTVNVVTRHQILR